MRSIINSYYRYVGKNSTNDSNEEYLNVAPILPSDCQRDPEHEPNQAKIRQSLLSKKDALNQRLTGLRLYFRSCRIGADLGSLRDHSHVRGYRRTRDNW